MTKQTSPRPAEGTALLHPAEAAVELRVSKATIYRLVNDGHLHAVHVGRGKTRPHVRISRADLAAFIAGRTS